MLWWVSAAFDRSPPDLPEMDLSRPRQAGRFPINGGFIRKFIYQWWILKKNFAMFDSQRASGRFWRKKWIWTCNKGRMWWIHRISCEHRHTPSTREILCTNPVDILWLYQFGWSGFRRKLDTPMKKWIRRLKYDQPFCFRWTRHGYGSKLGHFFEWSMLKLD